MTEFFGSLSNYPGNTGTYYYSKFFEEYKYQAEYNAFGVKDLSSGISDLISKGYKGFSLSMPFKQEIIDHLDVSDSLCQKYKSCNTVLIKNDTLHGFNTDIYGVYRVVKEISADDKVVVLGNGCMGKMFVSYLAHMGLNFKVFAPSLANWDQRHTASTVVINCTPYGTANTKSPLESLVGTNKVYDLTFNGKDLAKQSAKVDYYSGIYFYKEVFLKQFQLYSGIIADPDMFDYFTTKRIMLN